MGSRKTPVISFWPMRDKWRKYGEYWEMWGQDGDLRPIGNGVVGMVAPAEYKLIYFVIPGTNMVCQVAYEVDKEQEETGKTALRRNGRIAENLRKGLHAVESQMGKVING